MKKLIIAIATIAIAFISCNDNDISVKTKLKENVAKADSTKAPEIKGMKISD